MAKIKMSNGKVSERKKLGRPKMTDEQKDIAKLQRDFEDLEGKFDDLVKEVRKLSKKLTK